MNKQEKKFFVPQLYTNNNNIKRRWFIWYYIPHPECKSVAKRVRLYGGINSFQTIEERHIKANELISTLNLNTPKQPTFFEKLFEYETLSWRKKTVSAYSTVVKKYLEFLQKKDPINASKQDITDFMLHLYKKGVSKNTIEKYRASLFTLYEKAISHDLASINPVKKVKKTKRTPISLMYFNEHQIKILKKEIEQNEQLWLATQLTYYCFIRPGESRYLKISDINFDAGYIEVRSEISKNKKTEKVLIPQNFLQQIQSLKIYNNNYYVLSKIGVPGTEPISEKWIGAQH